MKSPKIVLQNGFMTPFRKQDNKSLKSYKYRPLVHPVRFFNQKNYNGLIFLYIYNFENHLRHLFINIFFTANLIKVSNAYSKKKKFEECR